jgi:hypothetical protein
MRPDHYQAQANCINNKTLGSTPEMARLDLLRPPPDQSQSSPLHGRYFFEPELLWITGIQSNASYACFIDLEGASAWAA